jgi:exodeoxyribonuclease VII large subunit
LPRPENLLELPRRSFDELAGRIGRALLANAHLHRTQFERAAGRLSLGGVRQAMARGSERVAALDLRAGTALARSLERRTARLEALWKLLDVVSYKSVLGRGFALISVDGDPVRSAAAVPRGKALDIEFADGHVAAVSGGLTQPPKRKRRFDDGGAQGSLL